MTAVVNKPFPSTIHSIHGFDTQKIYVSGVHVFQYKDEDCIRFRPGIVGIDYTRAKWHFELIVFDATYPQWHYALTALHDKRLSGKEENLIAILGQHLDTDYARALPTWREMVIPNDYETLQHVHSVLQRYMKVMTPLPTKESLA